MPGETRVHCRVVTSRDSGPDQTTSPHAVGTPHTSTPHTAGTTRATTTRATGADLRRGPLRAGDKVQLTDPKGRMRTITLRPGHTVHTHRGWFSHDELIGGPDGTVVTTSGGVSYLVLRPLLSDYVLSMPRGATVIYPKDAAQIITMADIYPGARVVEAGVGSGGLTLSLLRAVGEAGDLLSIERRQDFAEIAEGNVTEFFGEPHPAWQLRTGEFAEVVATERESGSIDRIVLDMLAPWDNLEAAATALTPGGVLTAYLATTTQLSRFVEEAKDSGHFTEPQAWESMIRGWHLEGLAVRPEHRMIAHTGFLVTTRRLAPGVQPPLRRRRPAPGAYAEQAPSFDEAELEADIGQRTVSPKKLRKLRRSFEATRRLRHESVDGADEPPGS